MGAWGAGLYSDDFALDVKSGFLEMQSILGSIISRNDVNYNYGYFLIASSMCSVPKSIRFIGNFAEYIPVDDGGNIEEASDGVIWKCFEKKIVKDYLRDIE